MSTEPTAIDWSETSLRATQLANLLDKWEEAKTRAKAYEAEAETAGLQVRGLLEKHKLESVKCGRYQPRLFTSHKAKRLSPDKLLELGVRQSIISKATVGGEEYTTFRIFDLGVE